MPRWIIEKFQSSYPYPNQETLYVQFDQAGNSGYQAASSDYTFNRTVASSINRYLDFAVEMLAADSVLAITDDNLGTPVPATKIGEKATISGLGKIEFWKVLNPATGTKQVRVQLSAAVASATGYGAYYNVHQTSPIEAINAANGVDAGAGVASVDITSLAIGCMIRAAIATDDTAITAGQNSRNNVTGVGGSGADEDFGPQAAGLKTMSYSAIGIGASWAMLGYAIRPASANALQFFADLVYGPAVNLIDRRTIFSPTI